MMVLYGLEITLLGISIFSGMIQLVQLHDLYGWRYQQTVIIKGVQEVHNVDLGAMALSILFLLFMEAIQIWAFMALRKRPREPRLSGPEIGGDQAGSP